MINIIKYIFLGILQGITEPLPISSSGHVFILRKIIGLGSSDLNFEIIVNFGSLLAIMIIYKEDIIKLIKGFFGFIINKNRALKNDFNYSLYIIIGSIPIGIIGFLFKDKIESKLNNIIIIGVSFIITSIFLFLVNSIRTLRSEKDINIFDAIIIGLTQIIAVFPGISRSGSTLIGGIFRKIDRKDALKYSFMLYIPVSIGSTIVGFKDLIEINNIHQIILPYGLGFIASLIVTFYTLKWFINIVAETNLNYFAIYTFIIGILIIIFR